MRASAEEVKLLSHGKKLCEVVFVWKNTLDFVKGTVLVSMRSSIHVSTDRTMSPSCLTWHPVIEFEHAGSEAHES